MSGRQLGLSAWVPLIDARRERLAILIARSIRAAAAHTPWESNCLPQAVAAGTLLRSCGVPHSFFLGVSRSLDFGSGISTAHAWVAAGRVRVSGGESFDDFVVLSCLVWLGQTKQPGANLLPGLI